MEFDKTLFLNNINYLARKNHMKKGDLEKKLGVSSGYISRISKKSNGVAAGVDFVKKVADVFGISVDVLISVDLSAMNDNDLYVLNFIKCLERKTESREVFWEKIEPREIREVIKGERDDFFPFFVDAPEPEKLPFEYDPNENIRQVYDSYFLGPILVQDGRKPFIALPWYKLKLDENSTLYLTQMYLRLNETDYEKVIELNIDTLEYYEEYDEYGGSSGYKHNRTSLCCDEVSNDDIYNAIHSLQRTIQNHQNDIRITQDVKKTLDIFMKS